MIGKKLDDKNEIGSKTMIIGLLYLRNKFYKL